MGKAADSERAKLRAAFFNNVAAGSFVAGILVPSITLTLQKADLNSEGGHRAFVALVCAFVIGFASRRMADYCAKHVPD
jgi:hypothetical protein